MGRDDCAERSVRSRVWPVAGRRLHLGTPMEKRRTYKRDKRGRFASTGSSRLSRTESRRRRCPATPSNTTRHSRRLERTRPAAVPGRNVYEHKCIGVAVAARNLPRVARAVSGTASRRAVRRAGTVSGSKSDDLDAMTLANILRTDAHLHRRPARGRQPAGPRDPRCSPAPIDALLQTSMRGAAGGSSTNSSPAASLRSRTRQRRPPTDRFRLPSAAPFDP